MLKCQLRPSMHFHSKQPQNKSQHSVSSVPVLPDSSSLISCSLFQKIFLTMPPHEGKVKFSSALCFLLHHCANAGQLTANQLCCSLVQSCAACAGQKIERTVQSQERSSTLLLLPCRPFPLPSIHLYVVSLGNSHLSYYCWPYTYVNKSLHSLFTHTKLRNKNE